MKKLLISFLCLQIYSGISTAMSIENSENFQLYTNSPEQEDDSANEDGIDPKNTPVGEGSLILLSMAGAYALRIIHKRNK